MHMLIQIFQAGQNAYFDHIFMDQNRLTIRNLYNQNLNLRAKIKLPIHKAVYSWVQLLNTICSSIS